MQIRTISASELVEGKEAFADALINLTYRTLSGEGDEGEYVFGEKPSRKFVAGFLLPQFDDKGTDDETNDIHISSLGMDFQVHSLAEGNIEVSVKFGIYVRVLPTWAEIERYHIKPIPQFNVDAARHRRNRINQLLNERWDEELKKSERDRLPKSEVRRLVSLAVDKEMGVVIQDPHSLTELDDASAAEEEVRPEGPESDDGAPSAELIALSATAVIPDMLAKASDIPPKWKRFLIGPARVTIPLGASATDTARLLDMFADDLWESISHTITQWLESSDGMLWAYRKAGVLPSNIASGIAWNTFLETVRQLPQDIATVLPTMTETRLVFEQTPNFSDHSLTNIRICLENQNNAPSKSRYSYHESAIFQVQISVSLPRSAHRPLRLERIQPSYRFRHFMNYAAIGINCGIQETTETPPAEGVMINTTWMPRYIQPRIMPRDIPGVPWKYVDLCDPATDITSLYRLIDEYDSWIIEHEKINPAEDETDPIRRNEEEAEFRKDIEAYRLESSLIKRGIDLLKTSQDAFAEDPTSIRAVPYRAWLMLNKTMFDAGLSKGFEGWRLFQEAFIVAHLPTLVSRMSEFEEWGNELIDDTVSLLYFSTGGGKSEAFYGLLIYNLFLDRLRGKHRGVTALIRYPLRLLTLEQAQRLFDLLSFAERVKYSERIEGAPFEIGFWVGNANTPNKNNSPDLQGIVDFGREAPSPDDRDYAQVNDAFNKIPVCPYCGSVTGLRRCTGQSNRVAIVCFASDCAWNVMQGGVTPLPFLLTDEDIYAHAPSIILGTIDKLALIGQHDSSINKVVGMLGLARFMDRNGRILMPRKKADLTETMADPTVISIAPSMKDGAEIFYDPFPSLVIQDEAHLLEESLGTFTGLFETTLEQLQSQLAGLLGERVARDRGRKPRMPKIIAATATISTPHRQMEALYQRIPLRFPYPGTSMYESFYTYPAIPPTEARRAAILNASPAEKERISEQYAPWMRIYASAMTNGRLHTVTTVNVLAAFHVAISRLWNMITGGSAKDAVELLKGAVTLTDLRDSHLRALDRIATDDSCVLSLLDLFRTSLTYVTNKKGGDQVIDALTGEAERLHTYAGIPFQHLKTELISGGVDIQKIQEIMREASSVADPTALCESLRNIVATSAISHGVDVDRFNAMFFAGMPSDIAEYIQASSRSGRKHVGFIILIPVPQKRRDRYVVEVHDIFHRFLERMIAPAAVERWAANALKRVIPSLFQAWLNGFIEQQHYMEAEDKATTYPLDTTMAIRNLMRHVGRDKFYTSAGEFILGAVGIRGRGEARHGRPNNYDFYESVILNELKNIIDDLTDRADTNTALQSFWQTSLVTLKPMTSLRDIDETGNVVLSKYLPERLGQGLRPPKRDQSMLVATRYVRTQRAVTSEMESDNSQSNEGGS